MRLPRVTMHLRNGGLRCVSQGEAHDMSALVELRESVPDAPLDEEAERLTPPPRPRTGPRGLPRGDQLELRPYSQLR